MTEQPTTLQTDQGERQSTDTLWEVADVAAFMNVSDKTVRRRIANGLPAKRIGGMLRFVPDEVRAWVDQQGVEAAS